MSENSIELVIAENPVLAITHPEKFAEFLKGIREELNAFKPDVSTLKGRKEIAKLAYKVTRTKTAIDEAGKELNAAKRKEIDAVDKERRDIRAKLDTLADEIRRPLTEWEEAEEKRLAQIAEDNAYVSQMPLASIDDGSDEIRSRIEELTAFHPSPEVHQDEFAAIVEKRQAGIDSLKAALERAELHEANQRELARLRAEAEERERREVERLEREAAEKAEAARVEREQKEARERAEREERERREIAERAAEEARQEEIRKAKAEQDERDRAAQAEIEAANRRAAELERAERERAEQAEKERAEQDAREADRKHRGEVMKAAKEAMMQAAPGINEIAAKQIVLAIVAGEIPNVTLRF